MLLVGRHCSHEHSRRAARGSYLPWSATDVIGDERDEAAKGPQRTGRVAEDLVCVAITTGAESGIQQLTQIERQMVGRCGMSEAIGLVAILRTDGLPAGA